MTMMKRIIVISCIAWYALQISGQPHFSTKSLWLHFQESDFEYVFKDSLLSISTSKFNSSYPTGYPAAAVPQIPIYVLINDEEDYSGFSQYLSERILFAHTQMNITPSIVSNNQNPSISASDESSFVASSFRDNVKYTGSHDMDGYKFLSFLISPFIYDSNLSTVSFLDSIKIEILLKNHPQNKNSHQQGTRETMSNIVKKLVCNSDEFEKLYPKISDSRKPLSRDNESFNYLIITHDSLANAFKPLAEWKRIKGLSAKIVPLSTIYSTYNTGNNKIKIKQFIKDCKNNNDTQYVLLGGDTNIVPVQKCYCRFTTAGGIIEDNTIPSDLFYSCLEGDLSWNSNGNGRIGEVEDNIELTPSIFLSRIPIRTVKQVNDFVNRVIDYEQHPFINFPNMLSCAVSAYSMVTENISDSHARNDSLYLKYIQPFWSGEYFRFYDTMTDFEGGSAYDVTPGHLQEQLSKGYTFAHINSHGSENTWKMEGDDQHYYGWQARTLNNNGYTIITTNACLTNDFDNIIYEPCLSESFLRNQHSGVLGYIGYTRRSYFFNSTSLSSDLTQIGEFYKSLFNTSTIAKSMNAFTEAITQNISYTNSYNMDRWNYMCITYMGDPEMNIYYDKPPFLSSVNMTINNNEMRIQITDECDHTTIAIRNLETDSLQYHNYSNPYIDINIPDSCVVYLTNQAEKAPSIFVVINNEVYFQNHYIGNNWTINAHAVHYGEEVCPVLSSGPVVVDNGNVIIDNPFEVVLDKGFEVKKGATFRVQPR